MPHRVTSFETTPNPNALKVLVDPSPGTTPRSYRAPDQAADDPLALALFAIPGITNLLIHDGWISISKSPTAHWKTLKPRIKAALADAPGPAET